MGYITGLKKNIGKGSITIILFVVFLLFITGTSHARKRALLIGVGTYENGVLLPGVDKDIQNMCEALQIMGFKENDIQILSDKEATLGNIKFFIHNWLINGILPEDRVLLYFSGHGSQVKDLNGDEADGVDEVLLPYDATVKNGSLENAFVDDDFRTTIEKIPSNEIFVLLDACHSGTATRTVSDKDGGYVSKFFYYEGMPEKGGDFLSGEDAFDDTCIALSACRDHEEALSNAKGSLLTRSILNTLHEADFYGKSVSMNQLKEKGDAFISGKLSKTTKRQHPQISGAKHLAELNLVPGKQVESLRYRIEKAAGNPAFEIEMDVKSRYRLNEEFHLSVKAPKDGYLNILNMDASFKDAVILFPNKLHPENKIKKGEVLKIPESSAFTLYAKPPVGKNMIVAFFTQSEINTYQNGEGSSDNYFKILSPESLQSLTVEKKLHPENFGSGITYIEIYE